MQHSHWTPSIMTSFLEMLATTTSSVKPVLCSLRTELSATIQLSGTSCCIKLSRDRLSDLALTTSIPTFDAQACPPRQMYALSSQRQRRSTSRFRTF